MEEKKLPIEEDSSAIERVKARLRQRRIAGVTIYDLSAILALIYMLNRDQPVNTFLDLVVWIAGFLALSILIWLVPMALFARYMEVSGEYENPDSTN